MTISKYILKNNQRQAAVKFVGSGSSTLSIYELLTPQQTIDAPNVELTISDIFYSISDSANVIRDGNVIISFASGSGDTNFSQTFGVVLNEKSNANVTVNLGTNENTLIMQLSKTAGYLEQNRQPLQIKDR